jgi:hypothetical protein
LGPCGHPKLLYPHTQVSFPSDHGYDRGSISSRFRTSGISQILPSTFPEALFSEFRTLHASPQIRRPHYGSDFATSRNSRPSHPQPPIFPIQDFPPLSLLSFTSSTFSCSSEHSLRHLVEISICAHLATDSLPHSTSLVDDFTLLATVLQPLLSLCD